MALKNRSSIQLTMKNRLASLITALRGRAEVYRLTGYYDKSIADFQRVISLCKEERERNLFSVQWEVSINVANILAREKSKYKRAKIMVEGVLKQLPEREEQRIRALAFTSLGFIYLNQGDYNTAQRYYQKAILIYQKLHDEKNTSRVYGSLGIVYLDKGDLDNALNFCQKDLAISKKLSNQYGISAASNSIGLIHFTKGKYDIALKYLKQHLSFSRKIGYKRGIALACNNIGAAYREKGDIDTALKYYEESLLVAEAYNLKKVVASVSNSMGLIYLDNENFAPALNYLKKYLAITESIGFKMGIDIACGNIGILYYDKGEFKNALKYYARSLTIAEEIGDKLGCGIGYLGISRINLETGCFDTILKYLKKAEKIFLDYGNTKKLSEVNSVLSDYFTRKGNNKKGHEFAEKALTLARKSGAKEMEVLSLRAIAKSFYKTNHQKAISLLRRAVAIARKEKGKLDLAHSLCDLADLLTIIKKQREAEENMKEAKVIFKRLGRV